MKRCKKCGDEKLLLEFHNDRRRPDGKYPNCKECHYAYMRNRYAASPKIRETRALEYRERRTDPTFIADNKTRLAKYYASPLGRARSLIRNALKSPDGCSLSLTHVLQCINVGFCPVTGIAFDLSIYHRERTGRHTNPFAPSLDRIEPKGSYTDQNTRVVIWQYNMMKGELSDSEVFNICRRIVEFQK